MSRFLLVDDDPEFLKALTFALQRAGHEVLGVTTGRAAIEVFTERPFDAVISDLMLPDMCGDAVAARIGEIAPSVPVVIMTASTESIATRSAVSDLLRKPFGIEVLLARLARIEPLR